MKKLVFINACIRKENSKTLCIAKALLESLKDRYIITEIDLTDKAILPITSDLFLERGQNGISPNDRIIGQTVASADRIVIAAPFWDMSFPSILKAFFEHISFPDITFENNIDGTTKGICKCQKVLYVTTRGMNIPTDSYLDQGTPYIRALCWLWGLGELLTVAAYGTDVNKGITEHLINDAIKEGLKLCEDF